MPVNIYGISCEIYENKERDFKSWNETYRHKKKDKKIKANIHKHKRYKQICKRTNPTEQSDTFKKRNQKKMLIYFVLTFK